MDTLAAWMTSLATLLAGLLGFNNELVARYIPVVQDTKVSVLFVGDMMFDRSVRVAASEKGSDFIFSCIEQKFREADYVVGNLEGPITAQTSKSVGSTVGSPNNTRFTFPTSTAGLLKRYNFAVVSLANNHANDFGREGVASTREYLQANGVGFFGDWLDDSIHTPEGKPRITYIGYNQFDPRGAEASEEATLAAVLNARSNGALPVVFAHWGDEYVPPTAHQKRLAREFIDAGAELVIGAHPHVVQMSEQYAGKHIYYSLGNFVFDQYWNEEVRTGLMVKVTFGPGGVEAVEESKTRLERDRRTCPVGIDEA